MTIEEKSTRTSAVTDRLMAVAKAILPYTLDDHEGYAAGREERAAYLALATPKELTERMRADLARFTGPDGQRWRNGSYELFVALCRAAEAVPSSSEPYPRWDWRIVAGCLREAVGHAETLESLSESDRAAVRREAWLACLAA